MWGEFCNVREGMEDEGWGRDGANFLLLRPLLSIHCGEVGVPVPMFDLALSLHAAPTRCALSTGTPFCTGIPCALLYILSASTNPALNLQLHARQS